MTREHDVCLLLEGTYPFVSGGVSTWVHNLITGMPEIDFTAVCILPSSKEDWKPRYELPKNFSGHRIIYLHDIEDLGRSPLGRVMKRDMRTVARLHEQMKKWCFESLPPVVAAFRDNHFPLSELIHGKRPWKLLVDLYNPEENSDSFLDYFWTYRFTHLPIFKILTADLPRARVYHAVSTGYAGLLGSVARLVRGRPLLLTEHGIYTKERKIEISQAEWIYKTGTRGVRLEKHLGRFQTLWTRIFEGLGRLTYRHAARIYTLYEGNRQMEIAEGADPEKVEIIPNGIRLEDFQDLKADAPPAKEQQRFAIGFVGRVVPIKDVKTFIRACKIVHMRFGRVQAYVMGPTEEDENYFKECRELVRLMRLEAVVHFTGKVEVRKYYPSLDAVVLTSISEAQPLVIMEANCAGIPAVASDVGACRELIEGRTEEDRALGPSGLVTKVADPVDTAEAILKILTDARLRTAMSEAGKKRIARYYRESELIGRYLEAYRLQMAAPDAEAV